MRAPIFVREFTAEERGAIEAGLRSSESFIVRRCQILLASSRGERASQISRILSVSDQLVLNVVNEFNAEGLSVLVEGSSAPLTRHPAFDAPGEERLREMLHQSPRLFGRATGRWTLELAAEVSFESGLTRQRVSGETIRATLRRMNVKWKRAKHWITSPDPLYALKKSNETDSSVS